MRTKVSGKRSISILAALVTVVAAGTVAAIGSPAAAAPAAEVGVQRLQRGMNVESFDAKIAAENGYRIVTYADGSQQSVPIDKNDKTKTASPVLQKGGVTANAQSTVYGNCGYSFIESEPSGAHQVDIRSGYSVTSTAIFHGWSLYLSDNNGDSYQGNSGVNASSSWSKWWDNLNQYGSSFEEVRTSSYAQLANGSRCYSGGPYLLVYVS